MVPREHGDTDGGQGSQMTGPGGVDAVVEGTRTAARPNYSGAIYGSMLAGSVVVGAAAGAGGDYHVEPVRLAVLLVATGLVFWLAHAYAMFVGDRISHTMLDRAEIRRVARHEWPLLQAALPPAAAALLVGLLGGSDAAAGWVALLVAIAAQVSWATVATRRSGASGPLVLLSGVVNLVLGLLIVILKTALYH
jgi:hypothetical protein